MSNDYEQKRSALTVSRNSIDAYQDELKRTENQNDKKSPALLKGWQKLYFMLIENLKKGLWKLKTDTKPNGAFDLIYYNYSKKEFTIYFLIEIQNQKSKLQELCQQQIATLNILRRTTLPKRTKKSADYELERTKLQSAMSESIRITKEINNPLKLKTILIHQQNQQDIDLNMLINQLANLRKDMLESTQACIVKDLQRKEIIMEYTDIYHERICDRITYALDKSILKLQVIQCIKYYFGLQNYQLQNNG